MKIININNHYHEPLTMDSTTITMDSTGYTMDQSYVVGDRLFIKITPSDYSDTVYLTFWNELKQTNFQEMCYTEITDGGYMIIPFTNNSLEEGDSLELTVRINSHTGSIIFRDKAYVTMQDDLENFKLNVVQNNRIIKI